jgi:hypothetical protein
MVAGTQICVYRETAVVGSSMQGNCTNYPLLVTVATKEISDILSLVFFPNGLFMEYVNNACFKSLKWPFGGLYEKLCLFN